MRLYKSYQCNYSKNRRLISTAEGIFLFKALCPKKLVAQTTLTSKVLFKSFVKSLMDPANIGVFLVFSAIAFKGSVVILLIVH